MPRAVLKSLAKGATRSALALPCPVPSLVPEPLDLKWLTMTAKASASGLPTFLNACASGSRALPNAAFPTRILDVPTRATRSGW
jgi:hypothetical protein